MATSSSSWSMPVPPISAPFCGLRFSIKILVLLIFLCGGVDHRQKQQQWHASKREEQQQHEQQQQEEGKNTTEPVVHADANATAPSSAPATPNSFDALDDGTLSLPHESSWLPTLGGLFLYEWNDWQVFDPLVLFLHGLVASLRGTIVALHWPEVEMALAGTVIISCAHMAYQETTRLQSFGGSWAHIRSFWSAKNIITANAARYVGTCESPFWPTSAQATWGNDSPTHYKDMIKLLPLLSGNFENSTLIQSSHSTVDNKEMPHSMEGSPAMRHHYKSKFWLLLGRGGRYHGTALNFLAKAWLPPGAQEWLEVTQGRCIDCLGDLIGKFGVKTTEMEQKFGCWSCRALIGVGMCISFKAGVSRIYCEFIGPTMPYLFSIIAILVKWWMRGFLWRREQRGLSQQAAEDTSVIERRGAEELPGAFDRMGMFSFRYRSEETDRRYVAASIARAQEEEQQKQQLREQEILRGKRQYALLKILRSMTAQRRAADTMAMIYIYTESWQLLRRLYTLERDESRPWSVREQKLRHLWPIFDVRWQALKAWTNGYVPREHSLVSCGSHIESVKLARLYSRLARAQYMNTDTYYKWPRPSATRQDVKRKIQWRECADLAALRLQVLAQYWRECGLARQQMWMQGIWAVMMSHPQIRISVTGYMQNWKPRLRRRQLDHRQVPIWKSPGLGQPDIQILHAIELRSLDIHKVAPGAGLDGQVTLFSVDMRPQGILCPSKRPYLLHGWLDGPTEAKLAMAAMVPIRVAEQRRLLEVEPGIGMEQRRVRARLRALVLANLTDHEMITLETAAAGTISLLTGIAGQWKQFLSSHQAVSLAVALEQARRRHNRAVVAQRKERNKGNTTTQVLWPNILELRLDLHHRPPSLDVITRHSHLAAVIMAQRQCPSQAPEKETHG